MAFHLASLDSSCPYPSTSSTPPLSSSSLFPSLFLLPSIPPSLLSPAPIFLHLSSPSLLITNSLSSFSPIPLVQSFLGSAEDSHDHSDTGVAEERLVLWKGSVLLGALLLFYVFEFFMKYWQDREKVTLFLHKSMVTLI